MKKILVVTLMVIVSVSFLFSQTTMNTYLRSATFIGSVPGYGFIPATDPYLGTVTVHDSLPKTMVDWVLVELRATTNGATIAQSVGCLLSDGSVTDTTGTNGLEFTGLESGTPYYIVVKHRNHLSVMSSVPVSIDEVNGETEHDFTLSGSSYGGDGYGEVLVGSVYAMFASDGDANGYVQTIDKNNIWGSQVGQVGYRSSDFDLNGFVQTTDKTTYYEKNVGKATQVPAQ